MTTKLDGVAEILEIPKVHENWHVGGTELLIAVLSPTAEEKTSERDHQLTLHFGLPLAKSAFYTSGHPSTCK